MLKKILTGFAAFVVLLITLNVIHSLQRGSGTWDGRSVDEILGVPAATATLQDIEKLSKSDVQQLYFAASTPVFAGIKGEYKANMLYIGILGFLNEPYNRYFLGPGNWKGKAFYPFEKDKGLGYNLWEVQENGKIKVLRSLQMRTFIAKSQFDDKDSFHLDYSPFTGGIDYYMKDEVRWINDKLYIGIGYIGHKLNPEFFVLSDPTPWVGPDKKK